MDNLSRKEFLQTLGLTGAGLALTAPFSKTLAAETKKAIPRDDWWIKEVDKPTVDIDWDQVARYSEWRTTRRSYGEYVGEERYQEWRENRSGNMLKFEREGKPGYTTKDISLGEAVGSARLDLTFTPAEDVSTPEERGVARYEGTPEENAQIIRAAMRHMGAANVGFLHRDEKINKLIYKEDPDQKPIVFEDVEVGYETEEKRALPNRAEWVIVYTIQMSQETMTRCPTELGSQTTGLTYTRFTHIQRMLQQFIRSLGYNCYGEASINALGIAPAMGVMSGLGELSRLNRLITPEYGPMVRVFKAVTDLPLAPSKPIDFGCMEFCKDCKKCATLCPSGALSTETEPTWETRGPWNNPGHKTWYEDSVRCRDYWAEVGTNCGICFTVCPYSKSDKASMHEIVKATAATTPAFNNFFIEMDDLVYENQKSPEEWWKLDLPELGIDTTREHG